MAKTKISEFSATPGNNTDIDGINIAEGCAPSGINDAIRELMAQLKDFQAGTAGDSFNGPVGTTTAAAGAFTTLTTSGAVTHNGGTANGVAYLNGSKVLTTGSALTFDGTNLGVGTSNPAAFGLFAINGASASANINASTGSAALKFYEGSGTGRGSITSLNGSDGLAFLQGTTEGMRLTSTGLGIGTSSPAAKLEVSGSGSGAWIRVNRTDSGSNIIDFRQSGTRLGYVGYIGSDLHVLQEGAANILFSTNNLERLRLDSSGNLGLGVTPSAWDTSVFRTLQVGSGAGSASLSGRTDGANNAAFGVNFYYGSGSLRYIANSTATYYNQQNGQHQWYTAPSGTAGNAISFTQAMTLDASGNLGVGSTSPSARLELAGVNNPQIALNGSGATGYRGISYQYSGTQYGFTGLNVQTGEFSIRSGESGQSGYYLTFQTSGSERARIDSSGNLLVGTTNTSAGTGAGIKLITGATPLINTVGASTGADTTYTLYNTTAGAFRFYVSYAGQVYATSTSISAISDRTLKTNVRDLDTGLNEVMALRPRRFDWKNGDAQNVAGFVAQEVEQVLPELVTDYVYNKDEDGNDIIKKSLKMGDILPTLVKAIQEQQAIITDLRARVAAIEAA